jgi:rhodanese-related sulfurtransferase
MSIYKNIDPAELSDLIAQSKVTLVDVRNLDEVARGVIAGADHIQLALLPLEYEKLTHADNVVFYCHSGIRSAHAADFAVNKGIKNVYNLAGGILAWAKAGLPLVSKN